MLGSTLDRSWGLTLSKGATRGFQGALSARRGWRVDVSLAPCAHVLLMPRAALGVQSLPEQLR